MSEFFTNIIWRQRSILSRRLSAALTRAFRLSLSFPEGPNDLFVVRVAGNGLGDDVLGSLNYAVDHLGDSLRTIVV